MKHPEQAIARAGVTKPGSVVAPLVRINDVDSCRQRRRPMGNTRVPAPGVLSASADFRYYVDTQGFQHFNFQQRIWRNPMVQMAVTPVMSTALETLALNLFAYITPEGAHRNRAGATSTRRLVRLARQFCAECLLTASPEGWVIPRSTIEAWLVSRRQPKGPATNASWASQRVQSAVARDKILRKTHTKERNTVRRTKWSTNGTPGRK